MPTNPFPHEAAYEQASQNTAEALRLYLDHVREARGQTPATAHRYGRYLRQIFQETPFFDERLGRERCFTAAELLFPVIGPIRLRELQRRLQREGNPAGALVALRGFLRFASGQTRVTFNSLGCTIVVRMRKRRRTHLGRAA